jgi:hypothetical protein
LDEEQRGVESWVLREKKKIDRGFVRDKFGVDISTASTYVAEFELTRWMMGRGLERNTVDLHNSGFFLPEPSLLWAAEFTSTAIKQQRYITCRAKGGKQQKYTKGHHVTLRSYYTTSVRKKTLQIFLWCKSVNNLPSHRRSCFYSLLPFSKNIEICNVFFRTEFVFPCQIRLSWRQKAKYEAFKPPPTGATL